jgi:hypothetical protein
LGIDPLRKKDGFAGRSFFHNAQHGIDLIDHQLHGGFIRSANQGFLPGAGSSSVTNGWNPDAAWADCGSADSLVKIPDATGNQGCNF